MSNGIFVGRFQPFHIGHLLAVKHIIKQVDVLTIVVGSAQISHQRNNPFTARERINMIKAGLDEEGIDCKSWLVIPAFDSTSHSLWVTQLNSLVPQYECAFSNDPLTIRLLKESGIEVKEVSLINRGMYSATEVRLRIAEGDNWNELVQSSVAEVIKNVDGVERIKQIFKI